MHMAMFATSLTAISHTRNYYRAGLADLRGVSADIRTNPGQIYWGDCGSRGAELLAGYVESTLPAFARNVLATGETPDTWMLVKRMPGTRSPRQSHDLTVYRVR